jgi:putative ABC transport system permease protein
VLRWILIARCLGAIPDALWMRHRYGGDPMLPQDLRYALRTLTKRPGFSTVVALTLALAIGANAAIFSVVNAVLLRQLPFREPDRLVFLYGTPTDGDSAKVGRSSSFPDYLEIRDQSKSFDHLAAFQWASNTHSGNGLTLTGAKVEPRNISGAAVTANFFPALGVSPILGRGIAAEEDRKGGAPVVVLGHGLWQTRFGGNAQIIGQSITLNGVPTTVIGIMPPGFQYPRDAEFWIPAAPQRGSEFRGVHSFYILGRLKRDVTLAQGDAEARTVTKRLEQEYPGENAKRSARLEPMHDAVTQNIKPQLAVLAGAVALVLLIGCTNIASLFLARAASREREAAVRTALGAARGQLVRQLLTESILLSVVGGALGLLVARWGLQVLLAYAPAQLPRVSEIGIDASVLVFLLAVSVAAGIAFGALPAFQFSRGEALAALRSATRDGSRGVQHSRLRRSLVMAEVALAVVLVVSAGLLIKSFVRLNQVEPGFDPKNLLMVPLAIPEQRYQDAAKRLAFYDDLRERIAGLPGVTSVSVSLEHPLSEGWTSSFTIDGRPAPEQGHEPEARVRPITPGYFKTTGVQMIAGRDIAESDRVGAPGVVVINQAFARKYFPGENPIGHRLLRGSWWPGMPSSFEIVGVAADERFLGLQRPADEATYFSFAQFSLAQVVLVRAATDPTALTASIRKAIWSIDKDLPVEGVQPMSAVLHDLLGAARFNTGLLTLFALVALALAALGVYGVLSYTVAQRTSEIGIRMALGAPRQRVLRLVVGEGVVLALVGVSAGLVASAGVTRMLSRLLFEVSTTDGAVFVGVAALLTLVAGIASFVPARRASRVDPLVALRGE